MRYEVANTENRPAKRREDSNFDTIWRYFYESEEIQLSELQARLKKRWDTAWKLLGGFNTDLQVIRKMQKDFPDLSERTIRHDIRNAKALFGDPANQNRMAERSRLNSWIVKGLKKSAQDGDWKAYGRLIDQYRKNNLLDKDDNQNIEDLIEHFKPHQIIFTTRDPEELKREAESLMKDIPAVDVEFTTVDDDED